MINNINKNKNILMIAYHFPPCSEAGVFRTLRFTKYLRDFGWEPIILTVKDGIFCRTDYNLFSKIPCDIKIIRSKTFEPLAKIAKKAVHNKNFFCAPSLDKTNNYLPVKFNLLWKLAKSMYRQADKWLMFPDRKIGWLPFAVVCGLHLIRENNVQAIYSSGSPWTAHLIGALLKMMSRIPWVADYRDYWTLKRDPYIKLPPLRINAEDWLENLLMHYSDLNIFVNDYTLNGYLKKYKKLPINRMISLSNGFDPEDFPNRGCNINNSKLEILHTGTASTPFYALEPFFRAIKNWVDAHPEAGPYLQIRFVGELGDNTRFIQQYGLDKIVLVEGPLPHQSVTKLMQNASVLLVVLGDHPPEIRAMKTLEYLAAGRPIWVVAQEGATTEIVQAAGCGWISHPRDERTIQHALEQIWESFQQRTLGKTFPAPDVVAQFDGKRLTGQLSYWLDTLIDMK